MKVFVFYGTVKKISVLLVSILWSALIVAYSYAYENSIYVWQRNWNENINEAVKEIQPEINHFVILCGDLKYTDQRPAITSINIRWEYFKDTPAKITLAFRINSQTSSFIETDSVYSIANSIKNLVNQAIINAAKKGIKVSEIQFDYDCPTYKLAGYANFLKIFKENNPGLDISITALPTWIDSDDFGELIRNTSYYVLQLHSFEKPKDMNQAGNIFLKDIANSCIDQVSAYDHPYYISLPTYGYEVAFTKDGEFMGLRAENMPITWGKDVQHKVVNVDPDDILTFLGKLKEFNPKNLLGICWYRLPLKSDEFNWDIKTLEAILEGKEPIREFKLEIAHTSKNLYEIYLINTGQENISQKVNFSANWPSDTEVIYDVLGQFNQVMASDGKILIEGVAPNVGRKVLVAWFRNIDKNNKNINLTLSEVKVYENN